MATAPLTASLTETLSKALNDKFYFGNILTKAQEVAALGPVFWGDTSEAYAKSKFAVYITSTSGDLLESTDTSFNKSETDAFSINCWVKFDNLSGIKVLISNLDFGTVEGYEVFHTADNKVRWIITKNGSDRLYVEGSTTLANNTWYNIAVSYDGTNTIGGLNIFINGVGESLTTITNSPPSGINCPSQFRIGCTQGTLEPDFNVDQVTFFNKALSSSEITALYNSGNGVHHKDLVGTESYYSSIAAWYDFNTIPNFGQDYHGSLDLTEVSIDSSNAVLGHIEGAAAGSDEVTKWTDRSASGFDVVQTIIADAATYVGNGFGSKGSFKDGELDINPEPFNFTGDFAVGCWFKQDELTQFRFPIGVWGSTGSRSFGIRNGSSGAGIQFAVSHDGSTQSNTAITDKPIVAGEWYFGFGWHENGVQIGFRMWDIAGNEIGVEQLDPHTTGVFNSTAPFRIGGHTNEWNGELGDVYVFDKLLTSQEQQKLIDYSRESAGYTV